MKKLLLFLLFFNSLFLSFFGTVKAVCPICTVAVAGGLGLSRYLGVDDTISGVWIGGLILSSSFWLIGWLRKKYSKLTISQKPLIIIPIMYAFVLLPLAWIGVLVDKLIIGTAIGSLAFLLGTRLDKKVRKIKGKQIFNYQKIVFPLSFLVIFSIIMYLVTK